jgi:hypothetical protein
VSQDILALSPSYPILTVCSVYIQDQLLNEVVVEKYQPPMEPPCQHFTDLLAANGTVYMVGEKFDGSGEIYLYKGVSAGGGIGFQDWRLGTLPLEWEDGPVLILCRDPEDEGDLLR